MPFGSSNHVEEISSSTESRPQAPAAVTQQSRGRARHLLSTLTRKSRTFFRRLVCFPRHNSIASEVTHGLLSSETEEKVDAVAVPEQSEVPILPQQEEQPPKPTQNAVAEPVLAHGPIADQTTLLPVQIDTSDIPTPPCFTASPPPISPPTGMRPPQRRALLIGISYAWDDGPEEGRQPVIYGPLHGVKDLGRFLKYKCGFEVKTMTDFRKSATTGPSRTPTYHNIRREIRAFRVDAQAGDTLLFYYAGHSEQLAALDKTESDFLDEGIKPSGDGEVIRDNELRRCLVDNLPAGVKFIAILDTCHSGTLLDLDHIHCNDIRTAFQQAVRRATDPQPTRRRARVSFTNLRHRLSLVEMPQTRKKVAQSPSIESIASASSRPSSLWLRDESKGRSLSPVSFGNRRKCDGSCSPMFNSKDTATVICLSSCKDAQLTWEPLGVRDSMTHALIRILEDKPEASLKHIMENLHEWSDALARRVKEYVDSQKAEGKEIDYPESELEQHPQLSSLHTLELDRLTLFSELSLLSQATP